MNKLSDLFEVKKSEREIDEKKRTVLIYFSFFYVTLRKTVICLSLKLKKIYREKQLH